MNENKILSVPTYKKVQIFKWLVKKHNCTIDFERDFFWKDRKKKTKTWLITPKLSRNGKDYVLCVVSKEFPTAVLSVNLPSKHATLSYADVLDALLDKIKKARSDCWLGFGGWPYTRVEVFLSKDTTLEKLCIEFDLAWRDAFGYSSKKPKKNEEKNEVQR